MPSARGGTARAVLCEENLSEKQVESDEWVLLTQIPGYEKYSRYAVSRTGAIKTCGPNCKETIRRFGQKALKAGHVVAHLCDRPGHGDDVRVALIVAAAFLPPRPSLAHKIFYRDGNPGNCAAENLRWASADQGAEFQPAVIDNKAQWMTITEFPSYRISDRGQVVHEGIGGKPDVLIKSFEYHGARRHFTLRRSDGRSITVPLAKLVAEHFLSPAPSPKHFLWYKDGEIANCAAENLYWTTRAYLDYLPMHDPTTGEEWRPCRARPDYQISSEARVRRCVVTCPQNPGYNSRVTSDELLIKTRVHVRGRHLSINLGRGREAHSSMMLHRLVCEAFHGPPPSSDHFVWFEDDDLQNCRGANLRWVSPEEAAQLMYSRNSNSEWRTVPIYDEYEVNAVGQVRRKQLQQRTLEGERNLKPALNQAGKAVVCVTHRGKLIHMLVHSLVAAAYLPPPPEEHAFLRHKDADPFNCIVENLEWTTHRAEYTRRYKARLAEAAGE